MKDLLLNKLATPATTKCAGGLSEFFWNFKMSNDAPTYQLRRSQLWSHSNFDLECRANSSLDDRNLPVQLSARHRYRLQTLLHYIITITSSWDRGPPYEDALEIFTHRASRTPRRVTPFQNTHVSSWKKRLREWTRARTTTRTYDSVNSGESHGDGVCWAAFPCRWLGDSARSSALRARVRGRGPRECGRAPLARTSPPNTTGTRATRRGEGRGSFETAMLPRRG